MSIHRQTIGAYVVEARYLDRQRPKTLTQMATELGTTKSTVRRWLRRDHWDLWMEHWASAEEIWEAGRQSREARRLVETRKGETRLHTWITVSLN